MACIEQIFVNLSSKMIDSYNFYMNAVLLYDSLGLRAIAGNVLLIALVIAPDIPEIFNFLEYIFYKQIILLFCLLSV